MGQDSGRKNFGRLFSRRKIGIVLVSQSSRLLWYSIISNLMQSLCRLSSRWHQQFCNSPAFAAHRQCLQGWTPVTTVPIRRYRQARKINRQPGSTTLQTAGSAANEEDVDFGSLGLPSFDELNERFGDDLVVREYEQQGSDSSTRRQIDPDKDLKDVTAKVLREIQETEKELESMREGPFGPNSPLLKDLPAKEREELLQQLAGEDIGQDGEFDELLEASDMDWDVEDALQNESEGNDLEVTLKIPRGQHATVSHFNKALKLLQDTDGDTLKRLNLWKWYLRCQQRVPDFASMIPEPVWDFLWQSQVDLEVRPKHLIMLFQDMVTAGTAVAPEQIVGYLEALCACGENAKGIELFEHEMSDAESFLEYRTRFLAVGIRLYAAAGRPDKAQALAYNEVKMGADAMILKDVITAWISEGQPLKAWVVYLRMRAILGDRMGQDDYSTISDQFLDANHTDLARTVFKDMVSRARGTQRETLRSYQQVLHNIGLDQYEPADTVEQAINQTSLAAMTLLPKNYNNKYFFASWIKKLLGQGRTRAASMVVDLMYERNIRPDAMHLNGLIGAWFRQNDPESQRQAEALARDMIRARIEQVNRLSSRNSVQDFRNVFRQVMPLRERNNRWLDPVRLTRPIPAANVETFSVLIRYYAHRGLQHEVEALIQVLTEVAQLRPNSFIINRVLESALQAHEMDKFWTVFTTSKARTVLDLESYMLAFNAILHQISMESVLPLNTRQLFADFMSWYQRLDVGRRGQAQRDFGMEFYAVIVRVLCFKHDLAGLICAMRGLHHVFQAYPDERCMQLIAGSVVRQLPRRAQPQHPLGRRRLGPRLTVDQTLMREVGDVIDTLEAKHKLRLAEEGVDPDELEGADGEAIGRVRLAVMVDFMTTMLEKMKWDTDNPRKAVRDVAAVMGVSDLISEIVA